MGRASLLSLCLALALGACAAFPAPTVLLPRELNEAVFERRTNDTYVVCYQNSFVGAWVEKHLSLNGQSKHLFSDGRFIIWKVVPGVHQLEQENSLGGTSSYEFIVPAGERILIEYGTHGFRQQAFDRYKPVVLLLSMTAYVDQSALPPFLPLPTAVPAPR